jgi:mannitol/fructose-specific phosphotransferase system IIA component (Ntr-type)
MILSELFTPGRIKIRLEAEDKPEVFEELVDLLVNSYHLTIRDQILEAIRRREEKMSTGIKKGIAIPHAKTAGVKGVLGVMGISPSGIDYDSLDGEPVHVLFLLVSAEDAAGLHLRVLKSIALLVENPDFYAAVQKAADADAAHRTIVKFEEILASQDG